MSMMISDTRIGNRLTRDHVFGREVDALPQMAEIGRVKPTEAGRHSSAFAAKRESNNVTRFTGD
jgi:hypothetical protein